jgi:hypothetical protein
VLMHGALMKWTPCQQGSESTISEKVLHATSNHLEKAKRPVGSFPSAGSLKVAKSGSVEQIRLSTTARGQQLTRTITVSN